MEKGNQLMEKLSKAYASLPDNEPLKADIFAVAQYLEKNENDPVGTYKTGTCHFSTFTNTSSQNRI